MLHSIRLIGLGVFFALAGLALLGYTLRKQPVPSVPARKSDERVVAMQQAEITKLRIFGAILVGVGLVMFVLS